VEACGGWSQRTAIPNLVTLPTASAHNSSWLVNEYNPLSPSVINASIVSEYAFKAYSIWLSLTKVQFNMMFRSGDQTCLIREPEARPLIFAVVTLNNLKYILRMHIIILYMFIKYRAVTNYIHLSTEESCVPTLSMD
jgi:hypothetical protein